MDCIKTNANGYVTVNDVWNYLKEHKLLSWTELQYTDIQIKWKEAGISNKD